jgi:hypothetical protein
MKLKGWVARDKDGSTCLFSDEPRRIKGYGSGLRVYLLPPQDSFPSLSWEDEPIAVEIEIKEVKL